MCHRVETDAVSSSFEYKSALVVIYNQLRSSEFQAMKFLCSDFVSIATMERIQNPLQLFQELEKQQKIGQPDNVILLAELLYHVGRSDQLKTLCLTKDGVEKSIAKKSMLDSFRVMLFKLSEQLTSKETKDLVFLYGEGLPKSKRDTIEKSEELFQAMEKHCLLSRHDPDQIVSMMESIGRSDLRQTVHKFFGYSLRPNTKDIQKYATSDKNSIPWHSSAMFTESDYGKESAEKREEIISSNNLDRGMTRTGSCEDNNAACHRLDVVNLLEDDSLDLPSYPMSQKPRGICLIINNENFYKVHNDPTSRQMPRRDGTQKDGEMLEKLFMEKLKFRPIIRKDLTSKEITEALVDIALKVDHKNYNCFVCCILSHGILGSVYGTDGRTVEIRDLTNFFKGGSCTSLNGKPKLFFIQACQGKDKQQGYPLSMDSPMSASFGLRGSADEQPFETIPNEADFLIGYATVPGYVSFRSKSQGTWYINTLVQMLYKYVDRYDLLSILIKVNEEVSRAIANMTDGTYKQSPMPMATLRKRIFFR